MSCSPLDLLAALKPFAALVKQDGLDVPYPFTEGEWPERFIAAAAAVRKAERACDIPYDEATLQRALDIVSGNWDRWLKETGFEKRHNGPHVDAGDVIELVARIMTDIQSLHAV